MDALLGDVNIPIPAPSKIKGNSSSIKEVLICSCVSNRKPMPDRNRPKPTKNLEPYLSDNQPLKGPNTAKAAETGSK
jgi:hypothetical protein